ncbi:uncharacterized protein LOC131933210 [Physella acuta]|uniref:uncharacterized protein LOC131933210 n=1 Tax=Physella acuta TaxID=109671 RepID=UPI0027DC0AAE|nr:uncharacterized protein LOC131933210 [Physella acuta]
MLFATLILSVFFIVTESETDQNSLEFQRANGINVTIDGYLPRCPGCVVFGRDPLIVYGKFHLPRDKWHIITPDPAYTRPQPSFFVSFCRSGCEDLADWKKWFGYCRFGKDFFKPDGCKLNDQIVRKLAYSNCYCDDTEPMRWFALIDPFYFKSPYMIIRAVWDGGDRTKPRFFPLQKHNTIYLKDIIDRGHIVMSQRSTNRSKSWAADLLLELTSVVLAFGTVAFFMS